MMPQHIKHLESRLERVRQTLADLSNPMPTIDYIAGLRRHAKLLLDKAERIERRLSDAAEHKDELLLEELRLSIRIRIASSLPETTELSVLDALVEHCVRQAMGLYK